MTFFAPRLLAQLQGLPQTGLEPSIYHRFPLPVFWAVALVLVGLALVLYVFRQRRGSVSAGSNALLAGTRMGLVVLAVWMLFGWMKQQHVTDLPDLVILLDESTSMKLADYGLSAELQEEWHERIEQELGGTLAGRLRLVQAALLADDASLLSALSTSHNLRVFSMADGLRPLGTNSLGDLKQAVRDLEPDSTRSMLGSSLQQLIKLQRGRPTTAIIVFTDGTTTEGPSLAEAAREAALRSIPLVLVGVGSPAGPLDAKVDDLVADHVAFVDDLVTFDFRVTASGLAQRTGIQVELREVGTDEPLASEELELDPERPFSRVQLSHRAAEPGEHDFEIAVRPLELEADKKNNRVAHQLQVRDEAIRVLLVQEYPSFEFRLLRDTLGRAAQEALPGDGVPVELDTVLQEADAAAVQEDPRLTATMPVSREELFEYDVILFGDVNPQLLGTSVLDNLVQFVSQRGGSLVFLAGPHHMPFAYGGSPFETLLPFSLATARLPEDSVTATRPRPIQLTLQGKQLPHLVLDGNQEGDTSPWESMPPCFWLIETGGLRDGVRVLIESPRQQAEASAVVTLSFVGAGKVLFHATDESWRWRGHPAGVELYQRYWMQTLRYLSRHQLLGRSRKAELASDREAYAPGERVRLRTRFLDENSAPAADESVLVVVQRENAHRRLVTMTRDGSRRGEFQATIPELKTGSYRAWLARPELDGDPPLVRFSVRGPRGEDARPQADLKGLERAADISGGTLVPLRDITQLPERIPEGRHVRIRSRPPRPLWNSPWLAWLFLALISSEWILRKRLGLV